MSRRFFLMAAAKNTKDLTEEVISRQVKGLARDPNKARTFTDMFVDYVDNELRLKMLQILHRPEMGWLVRKDLIARILRPFDSPYDMETSLAVAERLGRSKTPIREFFHQRGLRNPFSMRTRMENIYRQSHQGHKYRAGKRGKFSRANNLIFFNSTNFVSDFS
jgi:hypothetical protein